MTDRTPTKLVLKKEVLRSLGWASDGVRMFPAPTGSCNRKTTNCWTCTKRA